MGLLAIGPLAEGGIALPAGSAFEKVTEANKGDADIPYQSSTVRASADGRRITFQTPVGLRDGQGVVIPSNGLSTLGADGWTMRSIMPPFAPDAYGVLIDNRPGYQSFANDLSGGVFVQPGPPLTPGASSGIRNAYRRSFASGAYDLLTPTPLDPLDVGFNVQYAPIVADVTSDLSHVLYGSGYYRLTPDAPPFVQSAYEWVNGTTRLVGILPDGTPAPDGSVPGRGVGAGSVYFGDELRNERAMSADGSRIFFTTPGRLFFGAGAWGDLYVRENGRTTIEVSRSQRTPLDPRGHQVSQFATASEDGSVVWFMSCEQLTNDSTADAGTLGQCSPGDAKTDLYRFDVEAGTLRDLTGGFTDSVNGVLGASNDGESVYFATFSSARGGYDIYVARSGAIRQIATGLDGVEATLNWSPNVQGLTKGSEVSKDGRYLVFNAATSQGGIDTRGRRQVYLYDAEAPADPLTCISCDPAGGDPVEDAALRPLQLGWPFIRPYISRNINDAGTRVFFETPTPLVSDDINGTIDVYQYDIPQRRVELVSSGTGSDDAHFGDASADGSAVFFVTRQQLIPDLDEDLLADVYVARAGATPHRARARIEDCVSDSCQGPLPAAPTDDTPGSSEFSGPGDQLEKAVPRTANVFHLGGLSPTQRAAWARTGRTNLRIRVSSAGKVSARVRAKVGSRTRVVARASRTAREGGTVTLSLRLSPAARRQLNRTGRLRLTISVTYSKARGAQRATLTLRTQARGGAR
ncbi:MAG: hypothetical protein WBD40_14300 [Tepidisphaeraceae bacterium]